MPAAVPILIGTTIAGTALKTVGDIKAGNAASAAADYNTQVAAEQAANAIEIGQTDENRYRQGVKTLIGSQRAGFAGQGVDVGQGSPADVQADAAFLGELDALTIRHNAALKAHGIQEQGRLSAMQGTAQASADYFGAAGSVLGGTASLLQAKYGWGKAS